MLAKNCFLLGHASSFNSDKDFIEALSARLLGYLDEKCLIGTTIIFSVPGSGKSTLLKMFTPTVLQDIQNQNENVNYRELYDLLRNMGALDSNGINVIGTVTNMAEDNYRIIEDIYENGRAISIFFALLSLRIIRRMIVAICESQGISNYDQITFKNIPEEYKVMLKNNFNGKELYDWALTKEREICFKINNMEDEHSGNTLFSSLSVFRLLETGNILVNLKVINKKTLIMLDDCHTLSKKQREYLRDAIFKMKSNSVIWMAERKSALSDKELFGEEGSYIRYYSTINLDETIDGKPNLKMWEDVSDRRVKMTFPTEKLCTYIDNEFSNEEESKWKSIILEIERRVGATCKERNEMYMNLYEYVKRCSMDSKQYDFQAQAIMWKVLEILIKRKESDPQGSLDFIPAYKVTEFDDQLKALQTTAEFYIRREFSLPLYYGTETIAKISSRNIYQYIEFAGAVFDLRIALDITPRKKKKSVSFIEQNTAIKKLANRKWEMLDIQFVDSPRIKSLLFSIAELGIRSIQKDTASYPGGAFTGIGIRDADFNEMFRKEKYKNTLEVIRKCLSNNLLLKRKILQNNETKVIFSLNRWICIKYDLPLSYAGWKTISPEWIYLKTNSQNQ